GPNIATNPPTPIRKLNQSYTLKSTRVFQQHWPIADIDSKLVQGLVSAYSVEKLTVLVALHHRMNGFHLGFTGRFWPD
ncbi:hypothetical protein, partial [Parasedimentitalea denitrificans]|uniref:hypothetical protein n=1 Tax=Parasedimentitalea denitrificans TaxID=2211118 RepID=UPI00197CF1D0